MISGQTPSRQIRNYFPCTHSDGKSDIINDVECFSSFNIIILTDSEIMRI